MTVSDVLAQVIWLAGTLAVVAIIGAASYVITKLGELVAGRRVEVDAMLYLFGAGIGMVLLPSHAFASAASHVSKQTSTPRGPAGAREANDNRPRRRTARETARRSPAGAAGCRAQTPQRSAGVCTGASHSASVAGSAALTVIEQPAISSEVT